MRFICNLYLYLHVITGRIKAFAAPDGSTPEPSSLVIGLEGWPWSQGNLSPLFPFAAGKQLQSYTGLFTVVYRAGAMRTIPPQLILLHIAYRCSV